MSPRIALLPGDGIGPEVMAEARKVLEKVADRFGRSLEFVEGSVGGAAIDAFGTALPEKTLRLARESDGILFGAVGGPKWDDPDAKVRPEQGLLGLRKKLGLFANLRPVKPYPQLASVSPLRRGTIKGVDLLIVRELTGGLYFGASGRGPHPSGEQAFDTMAYNTGEIERIVRRAARAARDRRGRLTSVDKANVLETSRIWRSTAERVVREEFPDVELDHVLVDAMAMHLIQHPRTFDVIVTENLFGDILSDEASVLAGSVGMIPSGSLGEEGPGLFEPVHGSAPDIAGQGIANPVGMILSAAMMCRESFGWTREADCIEAAVAETIADGARTADLSTRRHRVISTSQMGDRIAEAIDASGPTDAWVSGRGMLIPLPIL